jgi:Ca2+-transporting ATPase
METHLEDGLTAQQARERLQKHGPNELQEKPRPGFFSLLFDQFNNFLVIILIVAAVVSLLLGEYIDATAIFVIVALNAIVGVVQESKAEAALAALKKMSAPNAQVMRGGRQITIASRELVAGDIVLVEAGNYIPADMRLIESVNLKVEEASLTGESVPVDKMANVVLDKEIPIGDRKNTAFMSTMVTYGRGKGLVTATVMHTQTGIIAEMIILRRRGTPLQVKLDQLANAGHLLPRDMWRHFFYGVFIDKLQMIFNEGLLAYLTAEKKTIEL